MAKANKKSAKEASNLFHNIMKASVSNDFSFEMKIKQAQKKAADAFVKYIQSEGDYYLHDKEESYKLKMNMAKQDWNIAHKQFQNSLMELAKNKIKNR